MKTIMLLLATLSVSIVTLHAQTSSSNIGKLRVVSQLKIRPGNVAVSSMDAFFLLHIH